MESAERAGAGRSTFMERPHETDRDRIRLAIIALTAVTFSVFAVRDASTGGPEFQFEGLLFEFAIYGIPLLVFAIAVWSCRWRELTNALKARSRFEVESERQERLSPDCRLAFFS